MSKKNNYNFGFTLIELLVVIGIIVILSTVVTSALLGSKAKSRDAIRVGDLTSLSKAAELYFAEHDYEFPNTIFDLDEYFEGGVPKDPQSGLDYFYVKKSGTPRGYCFGAITEKLENTIDECNLLIGDARYYIVGP